jgi:Na+-driven multidrug efflux pump
VSAVLLIAPVSYHRIVFRRHMKPTLVRHSHRMALGGLLALALAVVCSVFLIVDVVFGTVAGAAIAAGIAAWFAVFWYLIPWLSRGELVPRQKDY